MVKNFHLSSSCYKKVFVCAVLLIASCFYTLNAQVFQQPAPGSFPAQEASTQSGGGVYQPFSPFSPSQQFGSENQSNPILYGPGGNPIGGLPLADGTHIFFLCVMGYCIYKITKRQKALKS